MHQWSDLKVLSKYFTFNIKSAFFLLIFCRFCTVFSVSSIFTQIIWRNAFIYANWFGSNMKTFEQNGIIKTHSTFSTVNVVCPQSSVFFTVCQDYIYKKTMFKRLIRKLKPPKRNIVSSKYRSPDVLDLQSTRETLTVCIL